MRTALLPVAAVLFSNTAHAQLPAPPLSDYVALEGLGSNTLMFAIFMGAFAFAMWSATWLIRARRKLDHNYRELAHEHADLRARNERAQAMLNAPDQRIVVWDGVDNEASCIGRLPSHIGAPEDSKAFVKFENWLAFSSSQHFARAVDRLRRHAEAFDLTIASQSGGMIEAQGRASGSYAFVRFFGLTGDRAELANLKVEHAQLQQTAHTMRSLFDALSFPVWMRKPNGELDWANEAYIHAIEAKSLESAVRHNGFLLDRAARERVTKCHEEAKARGETSRFHDRLPATMAGDRRLTDVTEVSTQDGMAGVAIDMSEVEDVERRLSRTLESNVQTMDQLASAVAIFDDKRRLIFHNRAFEQLWGLDRAVLDKEPDNGQLFDILRDKGKLAENPDWTKWRNSLLEVYKATQPFEDWWHLPGGQTLRIVANPHKQGGVTWIFENITEQLEMESRYIALSRTQGETLDHLAEAIAVFSSDGRLKLSNPSFQELWSLEKEQVASETPISTLAERCRHLMQDDEFWDDMITSVTGVSEHREGRTGRVYLANERILDYALVPLPDGQAMLSFDDVSDTVNLEHTLTEKNEALEAGEKLKNDFLEHVSYEFRAPLTSIMGFSEMLKSNTFGALNEKQSEYVGDIQLSSKVLHGLVESLLDLATVDAGVMELDRKPVFARDVVQWAADGIAEELTGKGVSLDVQMPEYGERIEFVADPARVQQVLGNLLSNAVKFTPTGKNIVLTCAYDEKTVSFSVTDNGPGVAEEDWENIFNRFASKSQESGHRGAGLGLAIARSLVELHGGWIKLTNAENGGAQFTCTFPRTPPDGPRSLPEAA
ncbi:MAG: ATP-binding protein [Ahrensia sp.]|nr:ATP-binding protein [Ahrensia sp.]